MRIQSALLVTLLTATACPSERAAAPAPAAATASPPASDEAPSPGSGEANTQPAADPPTADAGLPAVAPDAAPPASEQAADSSEADPAPAEERATNLKVLNKDWSLDKIKKVMKTYSKALGVKCEFCHDTDDFASDQKKHKGETREMIRLQDDINRQFFAGKPKVDCVTCHRGKKEPKD